MVEGLSRRRAFTFVLITLLLDAMGIGLIIPVMPDLLQEIDGGSLGEAALWGSALTTIFAVMQFGFGPAVGGLSDRYGRRPILLVSLFIMALDYLVLATAQSLWLIIVARIVGGITAANQSTATAFIADVSAPEDKTKNFGLVGAAFGVGFVLGPLIGGQLGEYGTRAPFYAAAALAAANMVFGYFVMPETVTERTRRPFTLARANPLGSLLALGKFPGISRLLLIVFLYEFAFLAYPVTWAYFTQERFGWSPGTVGLSLALFGIAMAVVQGGLIRLIIPRLGERRAIYAALGFNFFAFCVVATIENGTVALLFTPFTALGAIITPALSGIMSRRVPDDAQGELQGLMTSARSMAAIFSPFVLGWAFYLFTEPPGLYLPGAPFVLSAALMILCATVLMTQRRLST